MAEINHEQPIESGDPLIDEIRSIRRELSERFGNDPVRLGEFLQEQERLDAAAGREVRQPPERGASGKVG